MLRLLLVIFSVIPGAGAVLLGRTVLGSVLLFVGLNLWNLALIGFSLWISERAELLGWTGLVLGATASLGSMAWTVALSAPGRQRLLQEVCDRAHRTAMFCFLRDKPGEAAVAVEAGLRANESDVDLLFMRWALARAAGGKGSARGERRRLLAADRDDKWLWEVRREEELRGGGS